MKFNLPNGDKFEIPDEWWNDAGMNAFKRKSENYAYLADEDFPGIPITLVPAASVEPVRRSSDLDFGGFRKSKMENVLRAIALGAEMPPLRTRQIKQGRYEYGLNDGYLSAVRAYETEKGF